MSDIISDLYTGFQILDLEKNIAALKDQQTKQQIQIDELINALVLLPGTVDAITRPYLLEIVERLRASREKA